MDLPSRAVKSQDKKSKLPSTDLSGKQDLSESPFQFEDNRPESVLQRKFREIANTNPVQGQENNTGLPDALKSGVENLSGYSMDDVKVHYNSDRPAQLQAHAYAQGTDIHLGQGQEKHLPHEAWHVVQQKQGRVQPTMQLKGGVIVNDDTGLENEADIMGQKALNMNTNEINSVKSEAFTQRKKKEYGQNTPISDNAKTKQLKTNRTKVKLNESKQSNFFNQYEHKIKSKVSVYQFANIIWSKDDPSVVIDIDFGTRSGKQDDHFTAFTVFSTGVLQNLRGQTLQGAIIQLLILTNEITEIPSFVMYPTKVLSNKVEQLKTSLHQLLEGLMNGGDSQLHVVGQLGRLIDDYLRIRNLVPGTKVDSSEAIRPKGYKGGGKLEKEGKGALVESGAKLKMGSDFSEVEGIILEALEKLHDYITNRKEKPKVEDFIRLVAQHFISILQGMPALVPEAENVLEIWAHHVFNRWSKILGLEWDSFTREVIGLTSQYVRSIGASEKEELGPVRLQVPAEEIRGLIENGRLPHSIFMIFIKTRARVFILNDSTRVVITEYSDKNIRFRYGPLGG